MNPEVGEIVVKKTITNHTTPKWVTQKTEIKLNSKFVLGTYTQLKTENKGFLGKFMKYYINEDSKPFEESKKNS